MTGEYIIEYTMNKQEAQHLYFNKTFEKAIRIQIFRSILLLPGCVIFAFFFSIALQVSFKNKSDYIAYILTVIFTAVFLFPFVKPIFKTRQLVKSHLKELFKNKNLVTIMCKVNDTGFTYKNDYFEHITKWDYITVINIDNVNVILQTTIHNIQYILRTDKFSSEAIDLIRTRSIQSK